MRNGGIWSARANKQTLLMVSGKCYIEHRWQKEFLQNNHKCKKNDPWVIKEITTELEHSLRNADLINQKQASVNTNEWPLKLSRAEKTGERKGVWETPGL